MSLKLSVKREVELVERTKKVLERLADVWDPSEEEDPVMNAHLEECSELLDQWKLYVVSQ